MSRVSSHARQAGRTECGGRMRIGPAHQDTAEH